MKSTVLTKIEEELGLIGMPAGLKEKIISELGLICIQRILMHLGELLSPEELRVITVSLEENDYDKIDEILERQRGLENDVERIIKETVAEYNALEEGESA